MHWSTGKARENSRCRNIRAKRRSPASRALCLIHFIVDKNGRVSSAQAIPLPLAAAEPGGPCAVRETYRFRPGPVRAFDISIEFKLE